MKTMTYSLFIGALMAASSMAFANSDSVYKWTDEEGVIHYSERAPKGKENVETIHTRRTKRSRQPVPVATQPAQETVETAAIEEKAEEFFKKDPKLCKQAKLDSTALKNNPIVRQGGKVMTLEQKNEALQNLKDLMKIHC